MSKERLTMTCVRDLLRTRNVVIGPEDDRDPIEIGLSLGFVSLRHAGNESDGVFSMETDAPILRQQGRILSVSAFGHSVHDVIESERQ